MRTVLAANLAGSHVRFALSLRWGHIQSMQQRSFANAKPAFHTSHPFIHTFTTRDRDAGISAIVSQVFSLWFTNLHSLPLPAVGTSLCTSLGEGNPQGQCFWMSPGLTTRDRTGVLLSVFCPRYHQYVQP
jgi:hypothetical protein